MPQITVYSCTPTAIGRSIANSWTWHYRVPQGAFERLELLEGKLSRVVLRGLGGSNPARLPGVLGNQHPYRDLPLCRPYAGGNLSRVDSLPYDASQTDIG
jgi:hypothetical protein